MMVLPAMRHEVVNLSDVYLTHKDFQHMERKVRRELRRINMSIFALAVCTELLVCAVWCELSDRVERLEKETETAE